MNKKLTIIIAVTLILATAFFVPLPGKPSLWGYLQQKAIRKHLLGFTDPVFLPGSEYRAGSTYSTYLGWKEAYEIRYISNNNSGDVISAYMIQFRSDSAMISLAGEGPSNEELTRIKNFAVSRTDCSDFDVQYKIYYCSTETFGYLIRTLNYNEETYYLAETVFNGNEFLEPKTTDDFKPLLNSNEHKILKSVTALESRLAEEYIKIDI